MAYTDFKSASQVSKAFGIKIEHKEFIQEKEFEANPYFKSMIIRNLKNSLSLINETVICEKIISPIITEIAEFHNIFIWSHAPFNVDAEKSLVGIPDYLIGVKDIDDVSFKSPIACLGEAKKENFTEAWGQVISEMYAAQLANNNKEVPVYGLVTTGKIWDFAVLQNDIVTIDTRTHAIPSELDKVFNILNWLFCEARKSIDMLEKNN